MTAFNYAKPLASANRLIERYGQLGVISHPTYTGPKHNPTEGAPFEEDARFVIVKFRSDEIDGTRILATDKKALLAPGALTEEVTTSAKLVEADATAWNIVAVETLRPAETTLLYTLIIRR